MNDLISRQTAIEAIKEDKIDLTNPNVVAVFKATGDFGKVETQVMTCDRHIKILKDLPSERKRGRWEMLQMPISPPVYKCSVCGSHALQSMTGCLMNRHYEANLTNYCPNCGADMMEMDDESN